MKKWMVDFSLFGFDEPLPLPASVLSSIDDHNGMICEAKRLDIDLVHVSVAFDNNADSDRFLIFIAKNWRVCGIQARPGEVKAKPSYASSIDVFAMPALPISPHHESVVEEYIRMNKK